jgi:hypothetical protein
MFELQKFEKSEKVICSEVKELVEENEYKGFLKEDIPFKIKVLESGDRDPFKIFRAFFAWLTGAGGGGGAPAPPPAGTGGGGGIGAPAPAPAPAGTGIGARA